MSDTKSPTTTCEVCDGSGQVAPMLSATDPANGPCETCSGVGAVSQTTVATGQVWRSAKTWWRVLYATSGQVYLEGPRGSIRTSKDGGKTWSELFTTMTAAGFAAWVRKSNATVEDAESHG